MKKILAIVTNKFLLTLLVFAVWMSYFDQNDYFAQRAQKQELKDVNDNIAYLNKEIARLETEKKELENDPQKLEQFAREQYRMKKDNEDVYVIQ